MVGSWPQIPAADSRLTIYRLLIVSSLWHAPLLGILAQSSVPLTGRLVGASHYGADGVGRMGDEPGPFSSNLGAWPGKLRLPPVD